MTKHHHQYITFLLFTLLIVCINSEVEDGPNKRDITQKSKSDEESDEKVNIIKIVKLIF